MILKRTLEDKFLNNEVTLGLGFNKREFDYLARNVLNLFGNMCGE